MATNQARGGTLTVKLVIYPAMDETRLACVRDVAGPMSVVNAVDESAALAEMPTATAFFGKITPALLAAAPALRWIQSPTVSLEHYVFPALVEHPATLTNMRGLFSDHIAEHVLGVMLSFTRNLHTYVRQQATATWSPVGGEQHRVEFATGPAFVTPMDLAHRTLADLTVGIVGLGAIGAETARLAAAFGTRVIAVDPVRRDLPPGVEELWPQERLDDLLAESDFVVVAAPHTPQTEGLFQRDRFQQMKSSACLINIGRGAIVELDDLVAALEEGEIAGAGLDVFQLEPLPPEHPLWKFPNVIITPHVAGYSPRVAERHLALLLDNIRRFVAGQSLVNVADKQLWY